MIPDSLYKDLLEDFKKQNALIDEQISTFEPLMASLRKPAAQRVLNKGSLMIFEMVFYALALVIVVAMFMIKTLMPFYIIYNLKELGHKSGFPLTDVNALYWATMGIFVLMALLCIYTGRQLRKIRLKNTIIHTGNKHIKKLLTQHLERKAVIDDIEQRHFKELPTGDVEIKNKDTDNDPDVNDVLNPGF